MAAKPITKIFIVLIIIVAGILVTMGARSRFLYQRQANEGRFVATYLAMSIAREKYIGDPDSLKIALGDIFEKYDTDSTWMANYGVGLSKNLVRSKRLWAEITSRLEQLLKYPGSDSLPVNHQNPPQALNH